MAKTPSESSLHAVRRANCTFIAVTTNVQVQEAVRLLAQLCTGPFDRGVVVLPRGLELGVSTEKSRALARRGVTLRHCSEDDASEAAMSMALEHERDVRQAHMHLRRFMARGPSAAA
jgi:hypothetical protein